MLDEFAVRGEKIRLQQHQQGPEDPRAPMQATVQHAIHEARVGTPAVGTKGGLKRRHGPVEHDAGRRRAQTLGVTIAQIPAPPLAPAAAGSAHTEPARPLATAGRRSGLPQM